LALADYSGSNTIIPAEVYSSCVVSIFVLILLSQKIFLSSRYHCKIETAKSKQQLGDRMKQMEGRPFDEGIALWTDSVSLLLVVYFLHGRKYSTTGTYGNNAT
jgi:hypothetical protein